MDKTNIERYMEIALEEAHQAFREDEIPIGAVVVKNGEILSRAHNMNRQTNDPTAHAELLAIQKAAKLLQNERLTNCDLFATKEPCAMCAGAIVHARIQSLFIGTQDTRFGACGTSLSVCGNKNLNHIPYITFGILEKEAKELLRSFFQKKR